MDSVFKYIRSSKQSGTIDAEKLSELIGPLVLSVFIDWKDPALRNASPEDLKTLTSKWDYGSWVDALNSAEIDYEDLTLEGNSGSLSFSQLSWPSGGIEATEELIRIFGGNIIENDAN